MLFQCGQVVRSHAGRDKGHVFVVIEIRGEYLYLVDGNHRRVEQPKKKKQKHVQPTLDVIEMIKERIEKNERLMNSEVRRHLIPFQIPETQ